jgi:hypothetical protein
MPNFPNQLRRVFYRKTGNKIKFITYRTESQQTKTKYRTKNIALKLYLNLLNIYNCLYWNGGWAYFLKNSLEGMKEFSI